MNIQTNIPLSTMTTMRIGGNASYVADVTTSEELRQVYLNAKKMNLPVYIIGGGSNLIAHDAGFNGVVAHMNIPGIAITHEDATSATIRAGAGEAWDGLVSFSVLHGLSGIESLSSIPGTVGAAPVQNIGAYGQEIADTLVSLEAYDILNDTFLALDNTDCDFSYRHSIFRGSAQGKYVIVNITLKLFKTLPKPPFYDSLQKYFDEKGITEFDLPTVRDAVIEIRRNKLPDPKLLPNSGSFFKNAVVEKWQVESLRAQYDDMPAYELDEKRMKVPAGWLIEQCDLKGSVINGMKVHEGNAVVLINESANTYEDLAAARDEIIANVRDKFQIILQQEPLELS